jgi:sugar phosphate isomerase/epimerase
VHAHLKDHVGKYPNWTHRIAGQGEMDYVKVFTALDRMRFAGSCSVECFTNMKFEEACDDGYRGMTEAARKAGARFKGAHRAAIAPVAK